MKTQIETSTISAIAAISIAQNAHSIRINLDPTASQEQITSADADFASALKLVQAIGAEGRWLLLSTDSNIISPIDTFVAVADGKLYLMIRAGKGIGYSTVYHALTWDGKILTADFDGPLGEAGERPEIADPF